MNTPIAERWPGIRKQGLRVFLTLVSINAVMGVVGILGTDFGDVGGRIFLTSLSLTLGVMLSLAASTAEHAPVVGRLWMVGVAAAVVGAALFITGIWTETTAGAFWKLAGTAQVIAAGIGVIGILSLAQLTGRYRWLSTTTHALVTALILLGVAAIWAEIASEGFWRVVGVVAVLATAGAITIPVVRRADRAASATAASVRFCPSCGRRHLAEVGDETRCTSCGTRFRVEFPGTERPGIRR